VFFQANRHSPYIVSWVANPTAVFPSLASSDSHLPFLLAIIQQTVHAGQFRSGLI
jgi:hypothetical protein